ncbi:FAM207A [Bugula neritina]|uniref:FAM207A n=1 Tax=Bugula neritina TaxID=10212 RepID=A0A7J7K1H5_BUGNE|nr:FAM207A [Bugula neritina]
MIFCRYILIMVKPKAKRVTARQRVERNAEKPVVHTKNDDVATIVSTAKSTPWDVRSSVFKNLEVGSAIIKDRLEDFDDLDAKTVITSKSFRGLNIRKKDKRRIKQHLFKQKINMLKEAKEMLKAKKKREKTVVTGDMKPMADSLPTVLPSVEQYIINNSTHKHSKLPSDKRNTTTQRSRRKQQMNDVNIFHQVLQHPEYVKSPSTTIQEHLHNRLILEAQTN